MLGLGLWQWSCFCFWPWVGRCFAFQSVLLIFFMGGGGGGALDLGTIGFIGCGGPFQGGVSVGDNPA